MALLDNGTIAIIGICVALGVCLIALLIFIIIFCRMRIQDDTNIRKRVLSRQGGGGYAAQQEIKTRIEEDIPVQRTVVVPAPVPIPVPQPRRQIIQEPLPPPPQPQQPDIVVHEVVHRYEPEQTIVLPQPQAQRIVRRSSWSEPHHHHCDDDWIMIKKKKKKSKLRRIPNDDDSSSSEEEEVTTRHRHGMQYMMPSLSPYDLAIPSAYQRRPMAMGAGMGMGAATYMVGARPMMTSGVYGMAAPAAPMMMAPSVSTMPMMAPTASTFQPVYGPMIPRM